MEVVFSALRGFPPVQMVAMVISAFMAWQFCLALVDGLEAVATKSGRRAIVRDYSWGATNTFALVFAVIVGTLLTMLALALEIWATGIPSMFGSAAILTVTICGWNAFRSNGVPFLVMMASAALLVGAAPCWYLLARADYAHPTALIIQALILIVFNPFTIYWVRRQYRLYC